MNRPIIIALVATHFVLFFAGAVPGYAAPSPEVAKQFILNGVARTIEALNGENLPRNEIAKRLRKELREGFDVPAIARFALGPYRRRVSEQQMRRYVSEFEELVVQTYTYRLFSFGPRVMAVPRDIIKVTGAIPAGKNQLIVRSEINRAGARWVKIDWRVRERDGRLAIIDVLIVGISQAQVYRSEFTSILLRSAHGIEGLIAALRQKSEELRAE